MYWPSAGSVSVTTVTVYGSAFNYNRNEFIEVRCLKSEGYSVCATEEVYDSTATRERNRVLRNVDIKAFLKISFLIINVDILYLFTVTMIALDWNGTIQELAMHLSLILQS